MARQFERKDFRGDQALKLPVAFQQIAVLLTLQKTCCHCALLPPIP